MISVAYLAVHLFTSATTYRRPGQRGTGRQDWEGEGECPESEGGAGGVGGGRGRGGEEGGGDGSGAGIRYDRTGYKPWRRERR